MATCFSVNNLGQFVPDASTPPAECAGYILLDAQDYALMVQSYNITSQELASVFGWGFGVVVFFWSLGLAIGVAKSVIKRV